MTKENLYLLGCLFAVNQLIENESHAYGIKLNDKWEVIPWTDIREWIENNIEIESEE